MSGEPASAETSIYRRARHARLVEVLERAGLDALLLRRAENFAWLTGGAECRVDHTTGLGVAELVVTRDAIHVLTTNIEARRMREEETPDLPVVAYPWEEGGARALADLTGGGRLGADVALAGAREIAAEVAALRWVLDPDAIGRYRRVGVDAHQALDAAAAEVRPGMSEDEAAALLIAACQRRGLVCAVALVAADGRIARYRHPIPRGQPIRERAMLVVCAERGGLYMNLTRMLHFTPPDSDLQRRQEACDDILRRMREEATEPGRTFADAFAECARFYAEAGYPDEWRLHHQGGLTGYATRELVATTHTHQVMQLHQAFAWNPSITGAKAEETFVLMEQGPEVL